MFIIIDIKNGLSCIIMRVRHSLLIYIEIKNIYFMQEYGKDCRINKFSIKVKKGKLS